MVTSSGVSILSTASASAFLNAFQAVPEAGVVAFPSVPVAPDGGVPTVSNVPARGDGEALRTSSAYLLAETQKLLWEEGDGFAPHSLPATGGEWTVNEFAGMPVMVYGQWVHASGRFLFLADSGDRTEVFAGIAAHGVLCSLANAAIVETGAVTTLFHIAFFDDGVKRLRSVLRRDDAPLFEVALSVADVIDRSGQYAELPQEKTSLYDLRGRRLRRLARRQGGMALETAAMPAEMAPLRSLELTFGGEADQSGGVLFPGALSRDGREYLSICLKDDAAHARGEPFGLHPELQKNFWDLAMILASGPVMGKS